MKMKVFIFNVIGVIVRCPRAEISRSSPSGCLPSMFVVMVHIMLSVRPFKFVALHVTTSSSPGQTGTSSEGDSDTVTAKNILV